MAKKPTKKKLEKQFKSVSMALVGTKYFSRVRQSQNSRSIPPLIPRLWRQNCNELFHIRIPIDIRGRANSFQSVRGFTPRRKMAAF